MQDPLFGKRAPALFIQNFGDFSITSSPRHEHIFRGSQSLWNFRGVFTSASGPVGFAAAFSSDEGCDGLDDFSGLDF